MKREEILSALKARFEKNMNRHPGLEWSTVHAKLEARPEKLRSLIEMERTGGEPDVVGYDKESTEAQYRELQTLGKFDTKTSSWVKTPADVRKLGGALFCDRRYDQVFVYHNGAPSYYAARAFRGWLKV